MKQIAAERCRSRVSTVERCRSRVSIYSSERKDLREPDSLAHLGAALLPLSPPLTSSVIHRYVSSPHTHTYGDTKGERQTLKKVAKTAEWTLSPLFSPLLARTSHFLSQLHAIYRNRASSNQRRSIEETAMPPWVLLLLLSLPLCSPLPPTRPSRPLAAALCSPDAHQAP